jgi:hypothetical protein
MELSNSPIHHLSAPMISPRHSLPSSSLPTGRSSFLRTSEWTPQRPWKLASASFTSFSEHHNQLQSGTGTAESHDSSRSPPLSRNLDIRNALKGYRFKGRDAVGSILASRKNEKDPSLRTTSSLVLKNSTMIKAGIPLVLFSILSAWVVSNAIGGKLKEMETSRGMTSVSVRQAALQHEHDEMMDRLTKIVSDENNFDNTKRIQRPHEILEQRRQERERRNVWYRRYYRYVTGQKESQ